ncbi:hypothetical protein THAOC_21658 [Thalassiosira oceanica]|uniref:Uncharacterized protein n=1 Tax=Thalassiosira oceanica TaxID=159749 RepID=K0SIC4_THAOC|nr:hypothetical protein THAOC_21658 [Thalassiosira oceanica]|eukprot:EJK58237.1 hypothetical protein THAOC_21658 [Thalassiosira oceanica]
MTPRPQCEVSPPSTSPPQTMTATNKHAKRKQRLQREGPDQKSYYHELFLCGKPDLTRAMKRLVNPGKRLPDPEGEPDFYAIAKKYPLPDPPRTGRRRTSTRAGTAVRVPLRGVSAVRVPGDATEVSYPSRSEGMRGIDLPLGRGRGVARVCTLWLGGEDPSEPETGSEVRDRPTVLDRRGKAGSKSRPLTQDGKVHHPDTFL